MLHIPKQLLVKNSIFNPQLTNKTNTKTDNLNNQFKSSLQASSSLPLSISKIITTTYNNKQQLDNSKKQMKTQTLHQTPNHPQKLQTPTNENIQKNQPKNTSMIKLKKVTSTSPYMITTTLSTQPTTTITLNKIPNTPNELKVNYYI